MKQRQKTVPGTLMFLDIQLHIFPTRKHDIYIYTHTQ